MSELSQHKEGAARTLLRKRGSKAGIISKQVFRGMAKRLSRLDYIFRDRKSGRNNQGREFGYMVQYFLTHSLIQTDNWVFFLRNSWLGRHDTSDCLVARSFVAETLTGGQERRKAHQGRGGGFDPLKTAMGRASP